MHVDIRRVEDHNVYEQLMRAESERGYLDAAAMAAEFSPIGPEDPEWQDLVANHEDAVRELSIEGLEVFGLSQDGEYVALCGYRMVSDYRMIVRGREVELPYEMFMVVNDGVEMTSDMVHAAQLFITSREGLRIVMLAH